MERCLGAGRPAFLALVASASRHSPGTPGARLVVTSGSGEGGGEALGTIGGGVLELRLLDRARRILRDDAPFFEVITYQHRRAVPARADGGEPSGLICGGWQTHVHRRFSAAADLDAVRRVIHCLGHEPEGAVLHLDESGLRVESGAFDPRRPGIELLPSPAANGPSPGSLPRKSTGSSRWVVREQLVATRRAAVMGAGHCGRALAATLARLGYGSTLFDDRPEVAAEAAIELSEPGGGRVEVRTVDDYRQAGSAIPWPEITPVVVMTTSFPDDVAALEGLLGRPFPFVGLMGSPAKIEAIVERLAEKVPAEALARLTAPVGLGIGSHTPEEIAISVAAQILERRAAWSADRLSEPGSSSSYGRDRPREVRV
ncbi:MAG: XdhC family protein [Holophagales bacterium]|nr:XdhC family protein [Holophagales bacterium]